MWIVSVFLPLVMISCVSDGEYHVLNVEDKEYWLSMSSARLNEVLKRKPRMSEAKNVIVFIGDGMGIASVTAGRIYQGQLNKQDGESNVLSFDKFPVTGLSKTYNVDSQVPDSASTATAIFSGVKTRQQMLGLDSSATYNYCDKETNQKAKVTTMMTWAQEKGKDTGIVTTTRITHATPAATYSHVNNRDWESDINLPDRVKCPKDIARQLVEDEPGKHFKVIMGGGRCQMGAEVMLDGIVTRQDNRNLSEFWLSSKKDGTYVTSAEELSKVNFSKTKYLLGLFSADHLSYSAENDTTRPSLKRMTEAAIKILDQNERGFVLMVEGGRIDHGHHNNTPALALAEVIDFDEAIDAAVQMTDQEETLIIVTADHSHSMTINGYPKRGNNILGLAKNDRTVFYETLTYANGPGFNDHHLKEAKGNCGEDCTSEERDFANTWKDIRNEHPENIYRRHLAPIFLTDETHGGEDVPIYAIGPMSHLFSGVHEQNYIATAISYAACIGPEAHRCIRRAPESSSTAATSATLLGIIMGLTAILHL